MLNEPQTATRSDSFRAESVSEMEEARSRPCTAMGPRSYSSNSQISPPHTNAEFGSPSGLHILAQVAGPEQRSLTGDRSHFFDPAVPQDSPSATQSTRAQLTGTGYQPAWSTFVRPSAGTKHFQSASTGIGTSPTPSSFDGHVSSQPSSSLDRGSYPDGRSPSGSVSATGMSIAPSQSSATSIVGDLESPCNRNGQHIYYGEGISANAMLHKVILSGLRCKEILSHSCISHHSLHSSHLITPVRMENRIAGSRAWASAQCAKAFNLQSLASYIPEWKVFRLRLSGQVVLRPLYKNVSPTYPSKMRLSG